MRVKSPDIRRFKVAASFLGARCPSLTLFRGEGSPTKTDKQENSGYPYSNLSNLEDLALVFHVSPLVWLGVDVSPLVWLGVVVCSLVVWCGSCLRELIPPTSHVSKSSTSS